MERFIDTVISLINRCAFLIDLSRKLFYRTFQIGFFCIFLKNPRHTIAIKAVVCYKNVAVGNYLEHINSSDNRPQIMGMNPKENTIFSNYVSEPTFAFIDTLKLSRITLLTSPLKPDQGNAATF